MLDFGSLNYWAVASAWLVNVVIGALWYSPVMFGKQWEKYTSIDIMKIPAQEANKIIGFVSLSAVFQVLALAVIISSLGAITAADGLVVGLVLWLGLVAATTVGVTLYSRRSWNFLWLNSSYFLVVMAINSIILAVWR